MVGNRTVLSVEKKKKKKSMFQFKVDIYKFYFLLFVKMRVFIFGDDRIFWTYLVGLCL